MEYIEPTADNEKTYSHRTYELLLRVCTECESVWRDMVYASKWNQTKRHKMKMDDYRRLDPDWFFSCFNVSVLFWRPKPLLLYPFRGWREESGVVWYQDYNAVKHNW